LPLRPELAADLKARMALFLPTAKAFPGMWRDKGAVMLRVDLEAAGIPAIDEYGRVVDFHSLRHTFGTLGAKAGIPLATMQN
jgi:integrase